MEENIFIKERKEIDMVFLWNIMQGVEMVWVSSHSTYKMTIKNQGFSQGDNIENKENIYILK